MKSYAKVCNSIYISPKTEAKRQITNFFLHSQRERGAEAGDWLAITADSFSLRQVGRETERERDSWRHKAIGNLVLAMPAGHLKQIAIRSMPTRSP